MPLLFLFSFCIRQKARHEQSQEETHTHTQNIYALKPIPGICFQQQRVQFAVGWSFPCWALCLSPHKCARLGTKRWPNWLWWVPNWHQPLPLSWAELCQFQKYLREDKIPQPWAMVGKLKRVSFALHPLPALVQELIWAWADRQSLALVNPLCVNFLQHQPHKAFGFLQHMLGFIST